MKITAISVKWKRTSLCGVEMEWLITLHCCHVILTFIVGQRNCVISNTDPIDRMKNDERNNFVSSLGRKMSNGGSLNKSLGQNNFITNQIGQKTIDNKFLMCSTIDVVIIIVFGGLFGNPQQKSFVLATH